VETVIDKVMTAPPSERSRLEGVLRVTQLDLEYLAGQARKGRGIAETLATQSLLVESIELGYQSLEEVLDYLEDNDITHLLRAAELVQTSDDVLQSVRALIEANKTQLSQHSMI